MSTYECEVSPKPPTSFLEWPVACILRCSGGGTTETNSLDSMFNSREAEMAAEGPCQGFNMLALMLACRLR